MRQPEDLGFDALSAHEKTRDKRVSPRLAFAFAKKPVWKLNLRMRLSGVTQYALFIGGLVAFTYGTYMIYKPLGPIVGGLVAVSLGMLLSTDTDEPGKQSPKVR